MKYRTGKIARLPRELRALVNHMLDDGTPYQTIIDSLNKRRAEWPPGISAINKMNLTHWKEGGYQDWIRAREMRAERQADRQSALEFLKDTNANDLDRALPTLTKLQMFQVLMRTDGRDIADGLKNDPVRYSRLLNSLLRLYKRT